MKYLYLVFIILLSGCGPSANSDGSHSQLTLKERYDGSIQELKSYEDQRTHVDGNGPGFADVGYHTVLNYLNSNKIAALKNTIVVYHTQFNGAPGKIAVFWVGNKLQIVGIQIADHKTGEVENIPLPNDFAKDLNEKQKTSVYYAAIFSMDDKSFQSLKRAEINGDKLEITVY